MFGIKIRVRKPSIKVNAPTVSVKRHKSLKGRTEGIDAILALTENEGLEELSSKALKIADKKFQKAVKAEESARKKVVEGEQTAKIAVAEQTLAEKQIDSIINVIKSK